MLTYFKTISFAAICVILNSAAIAQPTLKPSIGLSGLPADSDPICPISTYLDPDGTYMAPGTQQGDTIHDFTLYDLNGDSVNMAHELADGVPILLVGGSYTCPVYRNKVSEINNVISTYGNAIKVFVVYTVEAHPDVDISPYFGVVNTGAANQSQGILYQQPTTYGERKAIVSDMEASLSPAAQVLIDGPCNEWWSTYAYAPNCAFLIDTSGVVFSKHGWFDKNPHDIYCDVDSILGNPASCVPSYTGTFEWQLSADSVVYGAPGEIHHIYGELINNSADNVLIDVIRAQEVLPVGWASSLCLDACLPQDVDTTQLLLEPGESQQYTMYIYTDATIDSGMVRMRFRNVNTPINQYSQRFICYTDSLYLGEQGLEFDQIRVQLYPNPAQSEIRLSVDDVLLSSQQNLALQIYDLQGREVKHWLVNEASSQFSISDLPAGMYVWCVFGQSNDIQDLITSSTLIVAKL